MNTPIAARATEWNGHNFRSRLEARWAVFFHYIGLRWIYEPQGFRVPRVGYLPDFYLPDLECWTEVKPRFLTDAEDSKIRCIARADCIGLALCGNIGVDHTIYAYVGDIPRRFKADFAICRKCDAPGILLELSPVDHTIRFFCSGGLLDQCSPDGGQRKHERIRRAYHIARTARFEHGEQP